MTQEPGKGRRENEAAGGRKIWMTLTGLPLTFKLEWPFHQSTSGADFWCCTAIFNWKAPLVSTPGWR